MECSTLVMWIVSIHLEKSVDVERGLAFYISRSMEPMLVAVREEQMITTEELESTKGS